MTSEEQTLFTIKGVIASLSKEEQEKINEAYQELKAILEKRENCGLIAFALLGAENSMPK